MLGVTAIVKTPYADTRTCDDPSAVTRDQLRQDSFRHIVGVRSVLKQIARELDERARHHDQDKLTGISEFHEAFVSGEDFVNSAWWPNHLRTTRHHLNVVEGVPDDINLVDVLEFIVDQVVGRMARGQSVSQIPTLRWDESLQDAFNNTVDMVRKSIVVHDPESGLVPDIDPQAPGSEDMVYVPMSCEAASFLRDLLGLVTGVEGSRRVHATEILEELAHFGYGERTDSGPLDIRPIPPDGVGGGPGTISIVRGHRGTVVDDGVRQWVAWSDAAGMYNSDVPPTYQAEDLAEDLDDLNSRSGDFGGYSDWRPVIAPPPPEVEDTVAPAPGTPEPVGIPGWSWTEILPGTWTYAMDDQGQAPTLSGHAFLFTDPAGDRWTGKITERTWYGYISSTCVSGESMDEVMLRVEQEIRSRLADA